MTENKEVLKKLFKIAQNQQKMINKLAQDNISFEIQLKLDRVIKVALERVLQFSGTVATTVQAQGANALDVSIVTSPVIKTGPSTNAAINEAVALIMKEYPNFTAWTVKLNGAQIK